MKLKTIFFSILLSTYSFDAFSSHQTIEHILDLTEDDLLKVVKKAINPYDWNAQNELVKVLEIDREKNFPSLKNILLNNKDISYEERVKLAFSKGVQGYDSLEIKSLFSGILLDLSAENPLAFFHMKLSNDECPMTILDELYQVPDLRFNIYKNIILNSINENLQNYLKILNEFSNYCQEEILLPKKSSLLFQQYFMLKQKHPGEFGDAYYVNEFLPNIINYAPYILGDEGFPLEQKMRMANLYTIKSRNNYYSTPRYDEIIDFYTSILNNVTLEREHREKAVERLFSVSEDAFLKTSGSIITGPSDLLFKAKVAFLAKEARNGLGEGVLLQFLSLHEDDLMEYMITHNQTLPVLEKTKISGLHSKGAQGQGITVAVCDIGFFNVLSTPIIGNVYGQNKNLSADWYNEYTFAWHKFQEQNQTLLPLKFFGEGSEKIVDGSYPYHGSEMVSYVHSMAPQARILPVAVKDDVTSWVNCLNELAEDSTINIISLSRGLPGADDSLTENFHLVHPEFKKALLSCLHNGKIVVLAAGNNGMTIPMNPEAPNYQNVGFSFDMSGYHFLVGPSRISSLFGGEDENSPLFSNFLIMGSTKSDSLELHERSVTPGQGPAQKQYLTVDSDNIHSFFDKNISWGGCSASTAQMSGVLASLWSAKGFDTPGSEIVKAVLNTGDKDNIFNPELHGNGRLNSIHAFDFLNR